MQVVATTRLMPIHLGSGRRIEDAIDYVSNPEKTRDGKLVSSYECDIKTADAEFALSKRQYVSLTGRSQGDRDIIAYHTRQAFHPDDDLTPEQANRTHAQSYYFQLHRFGLQEKIPKLYRLSLCPAPSQR